MPAAFFGSCPNVFNSLGPLLQFHLHLHSFIQSHIRNTLQGFRPYYTLLGFNGFLKPWCKHPLPPNSCILQVCKKFLSLVHDVVWPLLSQWFEFLCTFFLFLILGSTSLGSVSKQGIFQLRFQFRLSLFKWIFIFTNLKSLVSGVLAILPFFILSEKKRELILLDPMGRDMCTISRLDDLIYQ